jgi:CheY-like chemotaxis protein
MSDRIKILIVDDIPETRDHLSKLLGYESDDESVAAAAGGPEAIEMANALRPDVVLMDINMPGMDGITATEKLAADVPTAAVIMMSVQGEADYLRRSMLAGAREFLVKPFSSDELTGVLNLLDVGDNIDLIISLRGDAFPVVQVLADGSVTVVSGINPLSIKLPLLLQDVQIIGVLDAPAPAPAEGQAGAPVASQKPSITGANKLLVLAVTPQQAEVLLFARTTGTLDAILRPPSDAGQTVETSGVILKTLVDIYDILPPEIVQVPIPTPLKK